MSKDLVLRLKLEDSLTPKLKDSIRAMENLHSRTRELRDRLDTLRDNKQGFLKGSIKSDIDSLNRLKRSIALVKAKASSFKAVGNIQKATKLTGIAQKLDKTLLSNYNREVSKTRRLLSLQGEETSKLNFKTQKLYSTLIKQQTAVRSIASANKTLSISNQTVTKGFSVTSNEVVRLIRRYESLLVGIYAIRTAYDATLGTGHEYNKLLENETSGMKILAVQNLQNIDTMGRQVTLTQKYTEATRRSVDMLNLVREINPETPYNLGDTIKTYKSLFPQLIKYKASLEDIAEVTKKMTILGKAMNLDTGQFIKTVDTAFTGAMKPSQMQLALNQVGITNTLVKKWQESGTLIDNILLRLDGIDPKLSGISQNFDTITSNFKTQWDELWGELQKPLFNVIKKDIDEASKYIKYNKQDLIGLGDTVGDTVKYVLDLGVAYGAIKIATLSYGGALRISNALIIANAEYNTIAQASMMNYGRTVSANTIKLKAMGSALKTFALTNPILLTATALMTGYELATSKSREQEDRLSKAVSRSRKEILELGKTQQEQARHAVALQIALLAKEKSELSVGASFFSTGTTDYKMTDDEKSRTEEIERQTAGLKKQLALYDSITPKLKSLYTQRQSITETIKIENQEIAKMSVQLATNKDLTAQERIELENNKQALQDNVSELKNGVSEIDRQRIAMGDVSTTINFTVGEAGELSDSLQDGAKNALALKSALISSQLIHGEINKQQSLDLNYQLKVDNANKIVDQNKRVIELVKIANNYDKQSLSIVKERADAQKRASESLLNDQRALYQAQGLSDKALKASIALVNSKDIPQSRKLLQIETLRLNHKKSMVESGKSTTKEIKKQNTELQKQQSLLKDSKLFNVGGDELVNLAKLGDELNELGSTFSQLDLAEIYEAKMSKIEDSTNDSSDKIKSYLEEAFNIDTGSIGQKLFDNLWDSLQGLAGAFKSNDPFAVNNATGDIITSSLDTLVPGAGTAVKTLGALLSTTLSEAEIKQASGRSGDDFTSDGTQQIISTLEQFMQPQLNTSKTMLDHLKSMDVNLIQALNASSSLDLGGSNYTPQTSSIAGGVIFASSTELLGAGIKFYDQAVSGFIEGVNADGYEAVKETSSWFGLFTSESVSESLKDLPSETKRQIGEAFNQGLQSSLDGLEILGFDTSAIEEKINQYVISIGKINFKDLTIEEQGKALNRALTQELNGALVEALNFAADPQLFADLESFKLGGEEITATIARVAIGFETVSTSLGSLGLAVDTFNQSQVLIDAMGGIEGFSSTMQLFTQNFFSPEEQKEINKITLETALLKHNVVLPASKAEFRNLFISTQQKILAVQADIDARKAEIRAQIEAGTFRQKIANENAQIDKFVIDGMALSGQAAVVAGKNFFTMYENMQGAAKDAIVFDAESGEISIDFDSLNDSTLNSLEATKTELTGLLGTLSSNMGGFVDYYSDSVSSTGSALGEAAEALAYPANAAIDALTDLADTLTAIANIQNSWASSLGIDAQVRSATLNREATGQRVNLPTLDYENYLFQFNALLARDHELHPETIKAWQDYGDALIAEHDAIKEREVIVRNLATGISDIRGVWNSEDAIEKAQRQLDDVQALNDLPTLNFDNFQQAFDDAVASGIDTDGLQQWSELSTALQNLNNAAMKASEGLDDFKAYANDKVREAFTSISGGSALADSASLKFALDRGDYDAARGYFDSYLENSQRESLTRLDFTRDLSRVNGDIQKIQPENPYKKMEDNQEELIKEIKLLREDNERLMGQVAFNTNNTVKNTKQPSIERHA